MSNVWIVGEQSGDYDIPDLPVAVFSSEIDAEAFADAANNATGLEWDARGGTQGFHVVMHHAVLVMDGVPEVRALHTAVLDREFATGWIAAGRVEVDTRRFHSQTRAVTAELDLRGFVLAGEAMSLHTNDGGDLVICGNDKALVEAEYCLQWRALAAAVVTA